MKRTFLIAALGSALVGSLPGCREQAKDNTMEKIATAYCQCAGKLAELNIRAGELQRDTARSAEFFALLQQMEAEHGAARECTATIIGQFGALNAAALEEVARLLPERCPELAAQRDLLRELLGE